MNTKKLFTSALIYLAVLFAIFSFSFWRLRALAEGYSAGEWFAEQEYTERDPTKPAKPFFSLLTNRSYGTNERARLWLNYRDIDAIDFRVYRVNDPAKFFHQLENPHQFGEDEQESFESYFRKRRPTFLEKVHAFKMAFYTRARDYFRGQLKNSSRRTFNEKFRNPDEELESQRSPLNVADYARVPLLNPDQMVTSWREKLPPLDKEYDRRPIPLGKREPGVYVVEAVNGDLRAYGIVMVTDLTMVEKTSKDGQLMIYAANRQTGAPRANVKLEITKGKDAITSGATDNQGIYRTTIKPKKETNKKAANADEGDEAGAGDAEGGDAETTTPSYVVMANEGGNFAISDLESYYFEQGGGGGEGDEEGGDNSNFHGYLYTDRPVYRTNQKVYFKGILRRRTEKGYALPSGPVTVSVEDPNSGKVFEKQMTLSSRGTFSGEVDIDEDAPLGTYTVVAESNDGTARGTFEVREYKKPEYKVTVTTPQKFIPTGTAARFTVSARYFFGSPVTKADVKYYVYRSRYYPTFFQEPTDPLEDFGVEDSKDETGGGYDEGDSMVEEGDGKLDSNGQLQVDFKVPEPGGKQAWDYTYRLEAQVTDAARREMNASGEFTGIRGTTVADAETEQYVYFQGDTAKVLVHTRDYDGKPKPANVTLKFVENTWERIEKNDYGYTYYDYKVHENELSSASVQTNDQGEASVDYHVGHPGDIQIKAIVNENGKQIASNGGSIWVADRNGQWTDYSYQGEEQIKLVPDKKSYKVGETAHVLALLPKEKAHLLVTTELMSVMSVREIDTAGRAAVIDVPIDAKFAPNIFLNVTYVRGGEMYMAEESIVVPPRDKLLKLDIIPNKSEYKPRETVSYTVVAHNGDGTPAPNAEVSLGVVDEAIYSVQADTAEDIRRDFYGRRYNEVTTSYSTNYLFTGYAGNKPMKLAENKRAYQLADFKNDANLVEPVVRKLFKDTAYWAPSVMTGPDGKATVSVQLPDNLTTWRATARAVTADTRVGVTTSKVVERKDVIIRLAMPRFLTAGDTVTISGIAHNYLNADKQTQISLSVNGAQLLDPAQQTVNIPHNGEHRIDWRVTAPQTGSLTLLGKALTDTESDAVQLDMPIVPRGLKQTTGQSVTLAGEGDEEKTFTINLPNNADPHYRTLRVEAAPSVAGTLFGALDYLTSYPYGCTEQTMSSFLPTVIVKNTLRDVQQASIRDTNNIDAKVRKGLKRLYAFQHDDGGWGWWKDDQTDPFMTAYVVDGLFLASKAGYQIDDERMQKAREKLGGLVIAGKNDDGKEIDMETRAYMIYAYSETGGVDARYVDDLYNNRGRLQPYGRALLALTLRQRGDTGRARDVASEIERTSSQTDFDAHWESHRKPMLDFTEENNTEATALSVKALSLLSPQSPVLAKAARWLVSNRRGGYYWQSTKQTAFAIYGLTDYLKVSEELSPDYALEVYVGNDQVVNQQITSTEAKAAKTFTVTRKNDQVGNSTQVRVVKRGHGVAYLSATLDYATTEESVAPQSQSGIKITREYLRLVIDDSGDKPKWKTEALGGDLHSGDTIVSRITVEGGNAQYLMIEDPIPAGCEQVAEVGGFNLDYNEQGWTNWYSNREFRDDRTVLFLNYFWAGKQTFQYAMQVQEPGDFRVAPARVELMYQPSVQSNTASGKLTILDRK
jgi:uncharacterized protein YfaS (alpha-2-macroglobulin family)